jgi:RimJ/RimL family protein N-acetyltransferase
MIASQIRLASTEDVPAIVGFLGAMQRETKELPFDAQIVAETVSKAMDENVFWFLFYDEKGKSFGTCYLQSLHNYWRRERRFYIGGFFIEPSHRGQGRFRAIYALLKEWVAQHDGIQIFGFIRDKNTKSLQAFGSVGMEADEYRRFVNHWGD